MSAPSDYSSAQRTIWRPSHVGWSLVFQYRTCMLYGTEISLLPGQQVLVNGRTWSYLINAHREVVSLSADGEEIDSVQLEYSPHWTGVARAIEVLLTPR
jgi:hypothetical protein